MCVCKINQREADPLASGQGHKRPLSLYCTSNKNMQGSRQATRLNQCCTLWLLYANERGFLDSPAVSLVDTFQSGCFTSGWQPSPDLRGPSREMCLYVSQEWQTALFRSPPSTPPIDYPTAGWEDESSALRGPYITLFLHYTVRGMGIAEFHEGHLAANPRGEMTQALPWCATGLTEWQRQTVRFAVHYGRSQCRHC